MEKINEGLLIKKKNVFNVISNFFCRFIVVLSAVIVCLLGISCLCMSTYYTNKYYEYTELVSYKKDNVLINIVLVIVFIAIVYLIYKLIKKKDKKVLIICVLIFFVVFSTIWVVIQKSPPRADQLEIVNNAILFSNGDYSQLHISDTDAGYLAKYPFQLGMVYYVELLFKIFNTNSPIVLQLANIIFSALCIYFIYKISDIMFKNDNATKILTILLFGFFYLELFNVYVYGNIIGMACSLFSILMTIRYLQTDTFKFLVLTAFSLMFAIIAKNNSYIFLIAILIVIILDTIKRFNLKNICGIVMIIAISVLGMKIIYSYTRYRTKMEVPKGVPMVSYLYMASTGGGKGRVPAGWYTGTTVKLLKECNYDSHKAAKESVKLFKENIKEMVKNPEKGIKFYSEKILSTWTEPSFLMIWQNKPSEEFKKVKNYIQDKKILISIYDGKLSKIIFQYFDIYSIIIFGFSAFFLFASFKKKKKKNIILILTFIGGFSFHLLWETKSIYVLPYYFILLPCSALGINKLFEIIENKITKK